MKSLVQHIREAPDTLTNRAAHVALVATIKDLQRRTLDGKRQKINDLECLAFSTEKYSIIVDRNGSMDHVSRETDKPAYRVMVLGEGSLYFESWQIGDKEDQTSCYDGGTWRRWVNDWYRKSRR